MTSTNEKLELSIAQTLVAQHRSKTTTELLSQALFAATPEITLGKEPTIRQFLDEASLELRSNDSVNAVVAADTHRIFAEAYLSIGLFEPAQEHADLSLNRYLQKFGSDSGEALTAQAHKVLVLSHCDQHDEAMALAGSALQRGRQLESLDADSSIRLRLLLTQTWCVLEEWDSAVQEAETVLKRAHTNLGPLHQQTFEARGLLTSTMIALGKLDDAKRLAEEQYALADQSFGATSSHTVQAVTLLFDLAEKRGDPESMAMWLEHLRGSEWEVPAAEMLKAAREQKQKAQ